MPVVFKINQQSRERRDRIVEIVAANPGISIGQIGRYYYEIELTHKQRELMLSTIAQLCIDNRIKHLPIDRYHIP